MMKNLFFPFIFLISVSGFAVETKVQCKIVFTKAEEKLQIQKDLDQPDRFESTREWTTKFLSDSDPTWKDPEYMARIQEFMVPEITNYGGKAEKLLRDYSNLMSEFYPGQILHFATTGTDANNLLFLYAAQRFENRHRKKATNLKILAFKDIYGGSHGPIANLKRDYENIIDAPFIHPNLKLSKVELQALKVKEEKVLNEMEAQMKDPSNQVGGIFMESIPASHGVQMYRTEFLLRLRALADAYQIPIFCDEILTGGGRTGEFWAFQHYKSSDHRLDFVPDLVTFGKGFAVAGVFAPDRGQNTMDLSIRSGPQTTSMVNPLVLVQSLQILKTIRDRKLVQQAAATGAYLMQKTYEAIMKTENGSYHLEQLRGIGLLITGFPSFQLNKNPSVDSYSVLNSGHAGRITPVLTTTKKDIDWAISKKLNWEF